MCRMVASIGNIPQKDLFYNFLKAAQGLGELNELNTRPKEYQHKDGWGVLYKEKDIYKIYKSTSPCWEDSQLKTIKKKEIVLLHARYATVGGLYKKNTHPFQRNYDGKTWFFCHNGTIKDKFPEFDGLEGSTDSEKLFRLILENFDEKDDVSSIEKAIKGLSDYTSLNSFLFNGQILYAINYYTERPRYFGLNLLENNDTIILSSEKLTNLSLEVPENAWKELKNKQIAKVDIENMTVELF